MLKFILLPALLIFVGMIFTLLGLSNIPEVKTGEDGKQSIEDPGMNTLGFGCMTVMVGVLILLIISRFMAFFIL